MTTQTIHNYRLWVSPDRCVLVRLWTGTGEVEVCTRDDESCVWGPPILLTEEKT